jgi:hypothetical protein
MGDELEGIRAMKRSIVKILVIGAAAAGLFSSASPAFAAGTYDGNWVFDFPQAGGIRSGDVGAQACPAFRVPAQIANNQISGSLGRSTSGTGSGAVRGTGSEGSSGSPITGQVQSDGSLSATWENYKMTGKLAAAQGQVTIARTQCGPRTGTAVRVGQ